MFSVNYKTILVCYGVMMVDAGVTLGALSADRGSMNDLEWIEVL
jgi:hypothetical protein